MLDREIYECFSSPARINGEVVRIGSVESAQLKEEAVFRGFVSQGCGEPVEPLPWLEGLVVGLRAVTTADDFNHEWWGAQTFIPEWARVLESVYGNGWLYFPGKAEELSPKVVGARLGFQLALNERKFERAVLDPEFLKLWEHSEFQKAIRGAEDMADKTRLVLTGFDSWQEFAADARKNSHAFRLGVFAMVNERAAVAEFYEFNEAFAAGATRAGEINLADQLSAFNERAEVVEILQNRCLEIDVLSNRVEITKYIRDRFSASRRKFLDDGFQWRTFTDRMREIYERVGLKKARRGRPRKNREIEGN